MSRDMNKITVRAEQIPDKDLVFLAMYLYHKVEPGPWSTAPQDTKDKWITVSRRIVEDHQDLEAVLCTILVKHGRL